MLISTKLTVSLKTFEKECMIHISTKLTLIKEYWSKSKLNFIGFSWIQDTYIYKPN